MMDPETMRPCPADGETMGEIMFRGNITMKGYLKNPQATEAAFAGGWFHSGDLAVMHPDGYIKIKDRSKDIIISGGENISRSRSRTCSTATPRCWPPRSSRSRTRSGAKRRARSSSSSPAPPSPSPRSSSFCRAHLARFKAPRAVVFGELPKTSTGKIQKFLLREKAQLGGRDRHMSAVPKSERALAARGGATASAR